MINDAQQSRSKYRIIAGGEGISDFSDAQHDLTALEIPYSGDVSLDIRSNDEAWLFRIETGPWAGKNAVVTSRYKKTIEEQFLAHEDAVVVLHVLLGNVDEAGKPKVSSVGYSKLVRVAGGL